MFFSIDPLIPQHGGKFATAWLAATRGIRYVAKKEVMQCDINKLCNSLEDGTPRAPIPRVQRKRKRQVVQLSEELIASTAVPTAAKIEDFLESQIVTDEAALARPTIHQVDSDLITLREELPIGPREEMTLGDFGVLEDVEPPAFPDELLQVAGFLPLETVPSIPEKRKAKDASGTPSKRRAIQQTLKEDEIQPISKVPPQAEVQVVPDISRPEIPLEPEGAPQLEDQLAEVPELEVQPVVRKKKMIPFTAKTNINLQKRRFVNINRCLPSNKEFFDLEEYENRRLVVLIKPITENVNFYELVPPFMEEDESSEEFLAEFRDSARTRESPLRSSSLSLRQARRTGASVAREGTPTPPVPATPTVIEPFVPEEPMSLAEQVDEPPVPMKVTGRLEAAKKTLRSLADSARISFPQIDTEILTQLSDRTVETFVPPAAETAAPSRAVDWSPTSSERIRAWAKDRKKRLKVVIKNWNMKDLGEITLEGVCNKPINRINIALAFLDLLSLHKMGYVVLNNKPESLELGSIEKGKRLLGKK